MTPRMTELLAREHQRELLDAAARYRLVRESRRPHGALARLAVFELVWIAKAVARQLDRIAEPARQRRPNATVKTSRSRCSTTVREMSDHSANQWP